MRLTRASRGRLPRYYRIRTSGLKSGACATISVLWDQ